MNSLRQLRQAGPVYVLRHGETEWNRIGRMQGARDSALTDAGRAQARAQAAILQVCETAGATLYSSPSGRTLATAAIISRALHLRIRRDDRLREIDMGDWTGQMRSDLRRVWPQHFTGTDPLDYYRHIPNGETPDLVAERLRPFLQSIVSPAVIVTHGVTSRVLRCILLGLPTDEFSRLEGGQGVVYRIEAGSQKRLVGEGSEGLQFPQNWG